MRRLLGGGHFRSGRCRLHSRVRGSSVLGCGRRCAGPANRQGMRQGRREETGRRARGARSSRNFTTAAAGQPQRPGKRWTVAIGKHIEGFCGCLARGCTVPQRVKPWTGGKEDRRSAASVTDSHRDRLTVLLRSPSRTESIQVSAFSGRTPSFTKPRLLTCRTSRSMRSG